MPVGIDLFVCRCMKACNWPRRQGLSRIRLNWQGDSRPNGCVSVPVAVSGAPVQKGFSAMNFRILAAPVWPRGRVFALVAITALTATWLAPDAFAQAPTPAPATPARKPKAAAPKAAPKAAPAAPAPAAQQAPPAAAAPAQSADQQVQ